MNKCKHYAGIVTFLALAYLYPVFVLKSHLMKVLFTYVLHNIRCVIHLSVAQEQLCSILYF
jgi:hypothetical protein